MVKVNYGALQTMSSTTSSASQGRVAGYQQLISAFSTFSGSYDLQGAGYDAARAYASGIMVSYYQACILYSEAVADAADYLADTYASLCGAENLDEEQLRAEISSASRASIQISYSIASLERKDTLSSEQEKSLNSLRDQASTLDEQIRAANEKLEHLIAFNDSSASANTEANDAAGRIADAEHTLGVSFAAGTFECTTSTDWADIVATKWEARAVSMQEAYDKALQKLFNGEELTESDLTAIERYNSEYPGVVDQEILQYTKEVRSVKAEEMRYRGVVDKVVEGKQLTSDERKFAKEFAAKYPDLEINTIVLSTVERQENYKKIIGKANKGKELSGEELDFLLSYYKDYPDVSVPKSVSKPLKSRKFEIEVSQSSLADLQKKYGGIINEYEHYRQTGQFVYTQGGISFQEATYIYNVCKFKEASGEETLQERKRNQKMFSNLKTSDRKKIDSKTLGELSSEHPEFMNGRTGIEFDYIFSSKADRAKKDYAYYRYNQLMKEQPVDWRDPDYMNKRNQYILKTGKNPSTGEKATKDEIFVAKNYGWVKNTTDIATGTIDLLDNLGAFQSAMAKISKPKFDTSKMFKKIDRPNTVTVPNTHVDIETPKFKPAKSVDLEVPVKPQVDVEVPKIKPVEAVAGAATTVPKSKKPDIDVLTKPKDLSTIKGEAVDHVGTVKPKVDLDVPKVKEISGDNVSKAVGGVKPGDVDATRVDSQKSPNITKPSRLEYLRNKYGTISAEELNQRINLRGETMKQYNAMKEVVKSKKQLGPAFSTVYDKTTGKYYSAINNFDGNKPGDLHPLLQERYNNASQDLIDSYVKTKGFASHAEVYAVNEALKANPNATMDDLLVNVIHADKGKSYINKMPYAGGEMFVRCRHCQYMLDGFNMISEVGK